MMSYDIFISYARKDNDPTPGTSSGGWVTAIRDHILADHRHFSTEPLHIFFDTDEIKDMDDWRHRILGALRSSKILLVCLSPKYFASPYCRWEWEEYTQRQVHQLMGSDSIATLYFVEVPGSNEQANTRWLADITRTNFTDIRPWFPNGAEALQKEEVRKRMAKLGESLWERLQRARRAEATPGNLRRQNPHFVGRRDELHRLHRQLGTGAVGVVTAVHGLGGQGKTELVVAYAHGWADCYSGGLWVIAAEGKRELLPLIGELAWDAALGFTPSDAQKKNPVLLGRGVLAHLRQRTEVVKDPAPDGGAAVLILLDNVSDSALLSHEQLAMLPRADWLRVVATTRLPVTPLKDSLVTLAVDSLDEASALALLRDHQPPRDAGGNIVADHTMGAPEFAHKAEEDAAREIVRALGGFTLAVEQVAVFLGLHPDVTPSTFLVGLQARGLPSADALPVRDPDVAAQMLTQSKQLAIILDATLTRLDPPTRMAIQFAALLPADTVPWGWLRDLTLARHPEVGERGDLGLDPWLEIRRRLTGLRLLTPGDHVEVARIHRLVAAHVRATATVEGELCARQLLVYAEAIAADYENRLYWVSRDSVWPLTALAAFTGCLLRDRDRRGVRFTLRIARALVEHWLLAQAETLLEGARRLCEEHPHDTPPGYTEILNLSGDVLREKGDPQSAKRLIERALELQQHVQSADPAGMARLYNNLAMTLQALGDSTAAEASYRLALGSIELHAGENEDTRTLLGVIWHNLGDLWLSEKRLKEAETGFLRAVQLLEASVGGAHLYSATVRQSLGVLCQRTGRIHCSVAHHRHALEVLIERLGIDHARTGSARAWLGNALALVGEFAAAECEMRSAIQVLSRIGAKERYGLASLDDLTTDYLKVLACLGQSRFEMGVALRILGMGRRITSREYLRLRLHSLLQRACVLVRAGRDGIAARKRIVDARSRNE